jgi:LCP family protein required for cell wall assembly
MIAPETPTARRRHPVRRALLVIGALLVATVVGVLAVAGIYTANLSTTFDSTKKITVEEVFPEETTRPEVTVAASQNILLMGSDSRGAVSDNIDDIRGTRSDTMMVVHIAADRESVHVMSIMRDSWVDIPGRGKAKMNAALSYGGVPLVVQTIESLISARIDRVAIVDFAGFAGITDALGGVRVENPIGFTATNGGYVFEPGPIVLNGDEALGFVRERYAFRDGDYQRVRNQQLFVKGVLNEILSAETLTNPVTINNLVASVAPFLTVDAGFSSAYAAGLGFELRNIRRESLDFFTMPTQGTGTEGSQSVVYVDWDELAVLQQHFRDDTLASYTPAPPPAVG